LLVLDILCLLCLHNKRFQEHGGCASDCNVKTSYYPQVACSIQAWNFSFCSLNHTDIVVSFCDVGGLSGSEVGEKSEQDSDDKRARKQLRKSVRKRVAKQPRGDANESDRASIWTRFAFPGVNTFFREAVSSSKYKSLAFLLALTSCPTSRMTRCVG
jgi:hypothetical protein